MLLNLLLSGTLTWRLWCMPSGVGKWADRMMVAPMSSLGRAWLSPAASIKDTHGSILKLTRDQSALAQHISYGASADRCICFQPCSIASAHQHLSCLSCLHFQGLYLFAYNAFLTLAWLVQRPVSVCGLSAVSVSVTAFSLCISSCSGRQCTLYRALRW